MAYNKVVYDGNVLIDLTDLDVTASDVLSGITFILADGTKAVGTLISTSTPTADTIAEFDSSAHMNSSDMTSQEVDDFIAELDVSGAGINTTQSDWIVESGTDGTWTWKKWQSGLAECWGSVTTSSITWSEYTQISSSMYYSSANRPELTFPFALTDPIAFASVSDVGTNVGWVANTRIYSNYVNCTVVRNGNSGNVTAHFFVKGRWK